MPKAVDITGHKFGRLTAIRRDETNYKNWICLCTCGKEKSIYLGSLRRGATKSCGCLHRENILRPEGQVATSHLLARCKANAKSRNIAFELTRPQFESIIAMDCAYCGRPPEVFNPYCRKGETVDRSPDRRTVATVNRSWIRANGIDRVNNSIGYTFDNSAPCCPECNLSKHSRSVEQFISHAKKVISFHANKANLKYKEALP